MLVGLCVLPCILILSRSWRLVRVRRFLPLAELHKVLDELDPYLVYLILIKMTIRWA